MRSAAGLLIVLLLLLPMLGIGPSIAGRAGEPKAGGDRGPTMTWFTLEQVGAQRETVPPLVLFVKGSSKIGSLTSPWSAEVTPAELDKIAKVLEGEFGKNPPPGKGEGKADRRFEAAIGGNDDKSRRFSLDETSAKKLFQTIKRDIIVSQTAEKAAAEFGKTFGW